MAESTISALMERMDTLSAQQARLGGSMSVIEQRVKLETQASRREIFGLIKRLSKDVKNLEKRMRTEPIALRQIYDTWWLRLLFIIGLGAMGADPKHILAIVLQLK